MSRDLNDPNKRVFYTQTLSNQDLKNLNKHIYFGFARSNKTNVDSFATQLITWEIANKVNYGYGNNPLGVWKTPHQPTLAVKQRYVAIKNYVREMEKQPSFTNSTVTLKPNQPVTLTDNNNVIDILWGREIMILQKME